MFKNILNFIFNPIGFIIISSLWAILVTLPYLLLKYVSIAIQFIATALPSLLLFGSTDGKLSISNLPMMFLSFIIIAVAVWLIFLFIVYIRYVFYSSEKGIETLKTACKFSFLCWVYIFIAPISLFFLYMLLDIFMNLINLDGKQNIATLLFCALNPLSKDGQDLWNSIADNNFFITKDVFDAMGGYIELNGITFKMLFVAVCGIIMIVAFFYAGYTIVMKVFDQYFLFICSPFVAASSVLDGGKRIAQLRDMIISKALVVFSIIIASRLFISLLGFIVVNVSLITHIESDSFYVSFPNYLVIILFALGGGFAFVEFGSIVGGFIGESGTGLRESRTALKASFGTVMAMAGTIGAGAKVTGTMMKKAGGSISSVASSQKAYERFKAAGGDFSKMKSSIFMNRSDKERFTQQFATEQAEAKEAAYNNEISSFASSQLDSVNSSLEMQNIKSNAPVYISNNDVYNKFNSDKALIAENFKNQISQLYKQKDKMTALDYRNRLNNLQEQYKKEYKAIQNDLLKNHKSDIKRRVGRPRKT